MFHDRTLNRSFLASVCANLVVVSLVGGSDLLKTGTGPIPPVIRHLPFFVPMPAPTMKPMPTVKTHPRIVRKPLTHQPVHRTVATARVAVKPRAHPVKVVKMASAALGTRVSRPTALSLPIAPTDANLGPETDAPTGPAVSVTPVVADHSAVPVIPGIAEKPKETAAIPPRKTEEAATEETTPAHRPTLADRTEPKALTEWSDLTAQFDPQSLICGVIKVQFDVDATGVPSHVKVIQSCGIPELDQSAVDACRAMRFLPAVQDGVARTVRYEHDFVVTD